MLLSESTRFVSKKISNSNFNDINENKKRLSLKKTQYTKNG
jgi:hypothetical protein